MCARLRERVFYEPLGSVSIVSSHQKAFSEFSVSGWIEFRFTDFNIVYFMLKSKAKVFSFSNIMQFYLHI